MPMQLFISHSTVDGVTFSQRLYEALRAKGQAYRPWIAPKHLRYGFDFQTQMLDAVRNCDAFIFVMSPDSVGRLSYCRKEYGLAFKCNKPVIPLKLTNDATLPPEFENLQYLNCTGSFESAFSDLCEHLDWLSSPEGTIFKLRERLAVENRELVRAKDDASRRRIEERMARLEQDIAEQQAILGDPNGAAARVATSIAREMEFERRRESSPALLPRNRFINPPPFSSSSIFQDRTQETLQVGDFLKDDSVRLVWVVGRGGVGKTALVCRLLKSLERGELPDEGGPLVVEGIVYLSAVLSRRVTLAGLYSDLARLLPEETARELNSLYRDSNVPTEVKMHKLVEHFTGLPTVVLLDNFEDFIHPETLTVLDSELLEGLRVLLAAPRHTIKVIVTTRVVPRNLTRMQPGRQRWLDLAEGLPFPYAENILRAMDVDGKLGLRNAPESLLSEARVRTRGFPKALEALFGILASDRSSTLAEILEQTASRTPEEVLEELIGEAFSRLDAPAQQVLQAIAIYGVPVPPVAINFLLQPYRLGIDSEPIANRLLNMKFLHKESGRYYLHPIDREYAMSRIAVGETGDREYTDRPEFTRIQLFHRAANYFRQIRKPSADWKSLDDLAAPLAEFELRCAGHEYETAATLLDVIDADFLHQWGHLSLIIDLRERLQGKLTNSDNAEANAGGLGRAYRSVGQAQKAARLLEESLQRARDSRNQARLCLWLGHLAASQKDLGDTETAERLCAEALGLARELKDQKQEDNLLGFLGSCKLVRGDIDGAIRLFHDALALAHITNDELHECADLSGLAVCFCQLGQIDKAMDFGEQALALARKHNNRLWLSNNLNVLGTCHLHLGSAETAKYFEEALSIARETGQKSAEAHRLLMLSFIHLNEGRYAEALAQTQESMRVAESVDQPRLAGLYDYSRAVIHFFAGDLEAASTAAQAACASKFEENRHNAFVIRGLIALKRQDRSAAQAAFEQAVAQAEALRKLTKSNADAGDAIGLALSGLAICGDHSQISAAIDAFRSARSVNRHAGLVQRVLRLFDALAAFDVSHVLGEVRLAAAGD